jgi:hypothetical protein
MALIPSLWKLKIGVSDRVWLPDAESGLGITRPMLRGPYTVQMRCRVCCGAYELTALAADVSSLDIKTSVVVSRSYGAAMNVEELRV